MSHIFCFLPLKTQWHTKWSLSKLDPWQKYWILKYNTLGPALSNYLGQKLFWESIWAVFSSQNMLSSLPLQDPCICCSQFLEQSFLCSFCIWLWLNFKSLFGVRNSIKTPLIIQSKRVFPRMFPRSSEFSREVSSKLMNCPAGISTLDNSKLIYIMDTKEEHLCVEWRRGRL